MCGTASCDWKLNSWPSEAGEQTERYEKDIQHAAGCPENGRFVQDAQSLAGSRIDSPLDGHSDWWRAHALALDRRRHSQRPQRGSQVEARPEGKTQAEEAAMTPRVAIYARVSTTNHGQDVTLQTRELQQFAEARGWQIAGAYIDEGVSGTKDSRPELNRLMADAHKRRFDIVCVWRFDRFARSVSHLLRALETFKALGIDFVSFSEQMDTSTPAGKMVFTVLGAVAELERSLIVERVKAGLRNAVSKGTRLGRPRAIVDAARIGRLRAQGRTVREIAEELGYSRSLVHKTLANRESARGANATD
jgi:DNA invertase Pin-like site-specific DNA recombinase